MPSACRSNWNSFNAGRRGRRRPYSHCWYVRRWTPSLSAIRAWVSPRRSRRARICLAVRFMAGNLRAARGRDDGQADLIALSQGGGLDEDGGGLRGRAASELLGLPAAAGPDVGVVTAGQKRF